MITLIEVKLQVPKESKELIDALALILESALEGKKLEAITDNLGELLKAVQGVEKIGLEVKSKNRDDISSYAVKRIQEAIDKVSRGSEINSNDI